MLWWTRELAYRLALWAIYCITGHARTPVSQFLSLQEDHQVVHRTHDKAFCDGLTGSCDFGHSLSELACLVCCAKRSVEQHWIAHPSWWTRPDQWPCFVSDRYAARAPQVRDLLCCELP